MEIAPLTFLVGCNSSGKSSIVKSLMLLKSFFHQERSKYKPVIGSTIDFSVKPIDSLGSFANVVRSSSRDKYITLVWDVYSDYINEDVTVSLNLGQGELGSAVVTGIDIIKASGETILSSSVGKRSSGNLSLIKDAFRNYLLAIRLRALYYGNPFFPLDKESLMGDYQKHLDALEEDALKYCDQEFLYKAVSNSNGILECTIENQAALTIDKFAYSGIITYFSLFDEMEGMSDGEEIRSFLKSKVKDNDIQEAMIVAIDRICEDYINSKDHDFLSYYRKQEDSFLANVYLIDEYSDILKNSSYYDTLFSPFSPNQVDSVYSIKYRYGNGRDFARVGFELVHDTISHLVDNNPYSWIKKSEFGHEDCNHSIHPLLSSVFKEFIGKFLTEIVSKDITQDIDYISSSRIQVRRLYPLEDRTDFTDAVRRYFDTKQQFMELNPPITLTVSNEGERGTHTIQVSDFVPGAFMNKWLKAFKIGDHISLDMDNNGLGILLKVYSSEKDKKGVLLADMGYGITQLFSILFQIEEMIMASLFQRFKNKVTSKKMVASGETLVVHSYSPSPLQPRTVAIEEPEIHLHPKFQSLLAEMLYEAYKEYNIQFVIETHSEYLLRKIQTLISLKQLSPDEVSMIYVEDDDDVKKGAQKVRRIHVKKDGRLADAFGPGFYDEADNLSLELFTNMGK